MVGAEKGVFVTPEAVHGQSEEEYFGYSKNSGM